MYRLVALPAQFPKLGRASVSLPCARFRGLRVQRDFAAEQHCREAHNIAPFCSSASPLIGADCAWADWHLLRGAHLIAHEEKSDKAATASDRFGSNLHVPGRGQEGPGIRRVPVVAGRPGEGRFTIRFADLRHRVSPTGSSSPTNTGSSRLSLATASRRAAFASFVYLPVDNGVRSPERPVW